MNRMNLHMDKIQDFVKTKVFVMTVNKKGKQVYFTN